MPSVTITNLDSLPTNAFIAVGTATRTGNVIVWNNQRGNFEIGYNTNDVNTKFEVGDKVQIALTVDAWTKNYLSVFGRGYSQPNQTGQGSSGFWNWSFIGGMVPETNVGLDFTNSVRTQAQVTVLLEATCVVANYGFWFNFRSSGGDWATASGTGQITFQYCTTQFEPVDPYSEIDGESDIPGDTVAIPGDPALSVTSTGIVGLFSPTAAQMQLLADFMWTDFGGTGTTVEDILSEIVQALKRSISNPLDYVIGLNIIPSQGLSKGSSKVIRFGFVSSGVAMPELNSQFFTVDCGSISFDYLCGNTFLDYAPYSKFSIYLPYIGVKEVDANDFVGHTIGVKYKGDVVTGGLTAFITKDGSVMYQYSGSCALNIPLTADNWGSTISAAINVATAVVGAASIPGAGLAASAAKAGKAAIGATVSNVAANPSLISPQVARSGAISGGAGAIGVQHPYVIREAVRFHSTANFNTLTGYPSYYFRSLADVTGYTVVYDCHLENIPATDGEIREIEQLLEGGVIL